MALATMWEARTERGLGALLTEWVHTVALPVLTRAPGLERVEVFTTDEDPTGDRVVVIAVWTGPPIALPAPPETLVARPPHEWSFARVGAFP